MVIFGAGIVAPPPAVVSWYWLKAGKVSPREPSAARGRIVTISLSAVSRIFRMTRHVCAEK